LKAALTKNNINIPAPPIVYFIVGGPGSGKGTQCDNLVKDYGFKHLSTGDLLRDAQKEGSKEGAMIEACIREGKLVSSDLIIALVRANMEKHNFQGKYLIDGLPRNA
jgi:adenylate kinase family enzyme